MIKELGIIILMLFQFSSIIAFPSSYYCKFSSHDSCQKSSLKVKGHVMCLFQKPGAGPTCPPGTVSGISADQKKIILQLHNQLRQQVARGKETRGKNGPQPAAKHMPNLEWDDELAEIAQRWADQCLGGHSCRIVDRFLVGQNVNRIESSRANLGTNEIKGMIYSWYNEVENLDRNLISSFVNQPGPKLISHYTQMVWAQTTKIGCGMTKYKNSKGLHELLLVCNYGESGNFLGEAIYETK